MSPDSSPAATPQRSVAARWTPPVLWLALILVGTSWPGLSVGPDKLGLDKAFHFTAYGVLSGLVLRATHTPTRLWTVLGVVAVISALGAVDEWHQEFIPRRSMSLEDWFADSAGAVVGALMVRFVPFLLPRTARAASTSARSHS